MIECLFILLRRVIRHEAWIGKSEAMALIMLFSLMPFSG